MDIRHPNFHQIVPPSATFAQVATGFDFLEGPIWHPTQKSVLFSDILGNSIYRWQADSGVQKMNRHSYMANGNAYDHQGRVVTCEHATSRITRTDFNTGTYDVLVSHYDGKALNSPNDIVVKRNGRIYFTDPTSGRSAGYGVPREPELPFSGVYSFDAQTNTLTLLIDDFAKPNGLCFSRDESLLYVNDTVRQHIRVFDVTETGGAENGRLFADLLGDKPGVADGIKVDSQGNVYSCGPGGIHLFTSTGTCLGVIETSEYATNFVFGDDDLCSLYVTATTSLYRLRVSVPGWATFDTKTIS